MIALSHDAAPFQTERVVILAAAKPGRFKACAKVHALHGGNSKKKIGNAALHAFKERSAQAHGQAQHLTFHHAAQRIALRLGGHNPLDHGFSALFIHHRERIFRS